MDDGVDVSALDIVRQVPVVDGRLDPVALAELVPAAVVDAGGNGWPTIVNENRLVPTIWQALREIAAVLDEQTPEEPMEEEVG